MRSPPVSRLDAALTPPDKSPRAAREQRHPWQLSRNVVAKAGIRSRRARSVLIDDFDRRQWSLISKNSPWSETLLMQVDKTK